jgi:glycerol kinase
MPSKDLSWLVGELRALAGDLDSHGPGAPLIVAIDQGGHASRAIAFDVRGTAVAESFAPISTFRAGKDRVEHDALEVEESIRTALADLHLALGDESNRIAAAGLATQRSSIACWNLRTNKPLAPILSWQDRRNVAFVERLRPQEATIRERTGLVLSPHYGASKMRWCLDEMDLVREAAARKSLAIGPLASWLLRAHVQERPHVVDAANAARTQLLDVERCDWSNDMLTLFGVAPELLPTVVPNRHPYGHIRFGDRNVPLIVCTGDQSAMPFAHGRPDPNTIYLNIGTGAFVQRWGTAAPVPDGLLGSIVWLDDRGGRSITRAIEGTVNGAGSAIDWLNERIGIDTHRAALSMTRAKISQLTPPLFLNGISGVGSPYWRASFDSRFIGEGNEAERVVAVVESIAFLICVNLERMQRDAVRILASGGLSTSDYLCECVASLSGLPVERTTLQESTATGLAYLIAGEPADWQPQARLERFTPKAHATLSERFVRWQEHMKN